MLFKKRKSRGLGQYTYYYDKGALCPFFPKYLTYLRVFTLKVMSNEYPKMKDVTLDEIVAEVVRQRRTDLLAERKDKKVVRIGMVALRYYNRYHNRNYPPQDNSNLPII